MWEMPWHILNLKKLVYAKEETLDFIFYKIDSMLSSYLGT